jgi:hypothetical protein
MEVDSIIVDADYLAIINVDNPSNSIFSMNNLDMFGEKYCLYNLLDSMHSQHIGYFAFFYGNILNAVHYKLR